MPDIVQELTIKAPPENVFAAITQHDEITQWRANHVVAEPAVSPLTKLRFDNGEVIMMEITDRAAGKNVSWQLRWVPTRGRIRPRGHDIVAVELAVGVRIRERGRERRG